ncbi:MAG: hypothetical protein M3R17_04325 [Bacteroidota bacterium]|nr:hypothetical protein [Bacteroidota bacterium]
MLFARLRPTWLLLLMLLPAVASAIFGEMAEHNASKHTRLLVMSVNLSTFFAMIFVCWIATLAYVLAPTFRSKFLVLFGLGVSVLFRLWQDDITLAFVNSTGKIPELAFISVDSPVFIMHVLVSLFMIALLILLSFWLLKKEVTSGILPQSKAKTILSFFVFPVGMFFIQPRMRKILDAEKAE